MGDAPNNTDCHEGYVLDCFRKGVDIFFAGWGVEYNLIFCLIFSYPPWFSVNIFVPPQSEP